MAQDIAIKTNGLYWLATTPNIGLEVATSDKISIELAGAYNRGPSRMIKSYVSGWPNLKPNTGSAKSLKVIS